MVTDQDPEEQTLKQHSCVGALLGEFWGWTRIWEMLGCDAVTTKSTLTPPGSSGVGCPIEWSWTWTMVLDVYSLSSASHWMQATEEGAWPWGLWLSGAESGSWRGAQLRMISHRHPNSPKRRLSVAHTDIPYRPRQRSQQRPLVAWLPGSWCPSAWDSYAHQGHTELLVTTKQPDHFRELKKEDFKRGGVCGQLIVVTP